MKKITASLLALLFLTSASMVHAGNDVTDKTVIAGAKTQAQIAKLLAEGC